MDTQYVSPFALLLQSTTDCVLTNNRHLFLRALETASPGSVCNPLWVWVRGLFWVVDHLFLTGSSHDGFWILTNTLISLLRTLVLLTKVVHVAIVRKEHGVDNYTEERQTPARLCQQRVHMGLYTKGVIPRRSNTVLRRIAVFIWKWLLGIRILISWLKPRGTSFNNLLKTN